MMKFVMCITWGSTTCIGFAGILVHCSASVEQKRSWLLDQVVTGSITPAVAS